MSRAAGTLVTTHNATYIPPRLMPGYKGHCPSLKFDYGETYGNQTAKHFQDYRSATLSSSASPYAKGGQFPTFYTHEPHLVISNRQRTRDSFLAMPRYELTNYDHDRNEEFRQFDRLAYNHREFYSDKSGTLKPVNAFTLANKDDDIYSDKVPMVSYEFNVKPGNKEHDLPRIAELH